MKIKKVAFNPNRMRYRKYRLLFWMMLLFAALSIYASFDYQVWYGVGWAILFLVLALFCQRKTKILKSGLEGEEKTATLLRKLPKEYTIYSTIPLEVEGARSEIDLLVISVYGLYVVEVKNHHGAIYGKKNQTTWRQERGKSIKYFKNPLKQLSQEINLLSKTLNSFHIHVPIQGCVFFSNVKRLRVDTYDVLMNDDLLLEKIQQERVPIIKKSEIRKIKRVLR